MDREEYKWTHVDTGTVSDAATLGASKPSSPTVSYTRQIVSAVYAQGKAPVKAERLAVRVVLAFKNADTADHTAYYTIEVNGTQVVDQSGGKAATNSTTTSFTEDIEVDMPSDGSAKIDVYAWTDDTTNVTLDSHQIITGVGTKSTSAQTVVEILDPHMKNLAMDVAQTGGTTTTTITDGNDEELLTTTGDVNIAVSGLVKIKLAASSGEVAWIDRVMLTWL